MRNRTIHDSPPFAWPPFHDPCTSQPRLDMYVHQVTIFFVVHIVTKYSIKQTYKPYAIILRGMFWSCERPLKETSFKERCKEFHIRYHCVPRDIYIFGVNDDDLILI